MSDLFSSSSSFDERPKNASDAGDAELTRFVEMMKQRAELAAQIHELNDICWGKCVDKPGSKLDARTEVCLGNCVNRFIDVSLFVTNRYTQLFSKQ